MNRINAVLVKKHRKLLCFAMMQIAGRVLNKGYNSGGWMSQLKQLNLLLSPPQRSWWKVCCRFILLGAMLAGVAYLAFAGWNLRTWVFEQSRPIRSTGDISNGFAKGLGVYQTAKLAPGVEIPKKRDAWQKLLIRIGSLAPAGKDSTQLTPSDISWEQFFTGYLKTYDLAAADAKTQGGTERYALDYTPLRLLVMSAWVKQVKQDHPEATSWNDDYTPWMLRVNSIFEIFGAVVMAILVWMVAKRAHQPPVYLHEVAKQKSQIVSSRDWPIIAGAMAGLIFWFNPSTLLDSHAWPQWDIWLVPFYLLAMLLAIRGNFFAAGVSIAIGAMFKGQILLAAPVFIIWPLFQFRLGRALLFVVGFACGLLLCASAWLVPNREAWIWIACVAPMAAIFATSGRPQGRKAQLGWSWWLAAVIASGLIVWPWLNVDHVLQIFLPLTFVALLCVLPSMLPRRAGFGAFIVIFCMALVLSAHRYDGSWNWFKIGFLWPTQQYKTMMMGYTANLAYLLSDYRFGIDTLWYRFDLPMFKTSFDLTTRHALGAMYGIAIGLCGLGAAIHSKRNDPRIVISLCAPWVLAFALLTQMHERYLVWGAAICGVGLAASIGMSLLHLVVISISSGMILNDMLYARGNQWWPQLGEFLQHNRQGLSWVMLLTAMIYLYAAIAPSPRGKKSVI